MRLAWMAAVHVWKCQRLLVVVCLALIVVNLAASVVMPIPLYVVWMVIEVPALALFLVKGGGGGNRNCHCGMFGPPRESK